MLTHAGQSYGAAGIEEIQQIAEQERVAVTCAADRLRALGLEVPAVSVGSTPTALHARSLAGVTDMRPGVYTLFDLAQVALGSCSVDDIAVSVLATVIGHNRRAGLMLIDAGALALSKDVSGNRAGRQVGYGLVCPATGGGPSEGLVVADVHQEHGLVAGEGGGSESSRAIRSAVECGCFPITPASWRRRRSVLSGARDRPAGGGCLVEGHRVVTVTYAAR